MHSSNPHGGMTRNDIFMSRLNEKMASLEETEREALESMLQNMGSLDAYNDVAAGERKLLGQLLVLTGKVNQEQVDAALHEQVQTGEYLGDLMLRKGWLQQEELDALLSYQAAQKKKKGLHNSPLKLGSLLVATGCISKHQRSMALEMQKRTCERLGDTLVNMGLLKQGQLRRMLLLQTLLFATTVSMLTYTVVPDMVEPAEAGIAPAASAEVLKLNVHAATATLNTNPETAEDYYNLAMKYLEGQGVDKCELTAKKLFSKAAEQGHTSAQYQLGMILWDNDDDQQAMELLTLASEKGHELAKVAYYTLVEDADYGLGC